MGGCSSKNTVQVNIARKVSENKETPDEHNDSMEMSQRLMAQNKRSRANTATTQNTTEHFDEAKITKVTLPGSAGKFIPEIHFEAGSAPLAPIKEGGAYILYSEKSTGKLKVIQIDNDGNKTREDIDLDIKGTPFDIISVPWGFVILANEKTDNHKLFVIGFTKDGKTKFSRTLINSSNAPSNANKDQIIFHDKDAKPMFGLQAIYDPHNGRLAWLNGRIGIIFAHYNYFGDKGGKRDVHTADTFITLDENGKDEKVGFAWGTSHSLNQQLLARENYFVTVSLGDAYPVNIKGYRVWNDQENLSALDPVSYKKSSLAATSNLLIEGDVVGNGQGGSCGRLGGLVYLKSKNLFAFVYSRRKCKDSYGGHDYNNEKNELAIVYMDEYLNVVKTVVIGDGEFINQIKTAKYGTNLLIQYSTTQRKDPRYPNNQYLHYAVAKEDQTYMMMVDLDGKVVTPPKLMSDLRASPSDDFEELSDGRVVWTSVDSNSGEISYFSYGPPINEEVAIKSNAVELAQKPENVKKTFGAFGMHNNLEKVPVEIISPLTPIIKTSEKSVAVQVKCPPEVKIFVNLEDFEGNKYKGLTRIVKAKDDIRTIHALMPKNGEFKFVIIFEIEGTPNEWAEFYVNATMKELPDPKKVGYADILSEDIVLLEPWNRYLKKGSTQHFKVQSSKASEVIAIINGKWLQIPKSEDIFEGDVELNEKEGDFYIWIKHEGDSNAHSAIKYQIYN